jgi:uncharacterized membrane protein
MATAGKYPAPRLLMLLSAAAYAASLLVLAARTPLWLDEVLTVAGPARSAHLFDVVRWAAINTGNVPLGFLAERFAFDIFGISPLSARAPSLICSLLSCAGMAVLARQMGFERGRALATAAVFALLPMQFRYAYEARPYAQCLLCGIVATIVFLRIARSPKWLDAVFYAAAALAGLYTQPFTLFLLAAHGAWGLCCVRAAERRRVVLLWACGAAAAVAGFIPWVLLVWSGWRQGITAGHAGFGWSWSILAMILRELPGNYVVGLALLVAIGATLRGHSEENRPVRTLLPLMILFPIVGALVADAVSGYFFAVRQLILVLPSFALLSMARRSRLSHIAVTAIVVASVVQDVRAAFAPRENWLPAASRLASELSSGGCFVGIPFGSEVLFEFFEPKLQGHRCGGAFGLYEKVVVVVTPYTPRPSDADVYGMLQQQGFIRADARAIGVTHLAIFLRPHGGR